MSQNKKSPALFIVKTILFLSGLAALGAAGVNLYAWRQAQAWPSVEGRVLSSTVDSDARLGRSATPNTFAAITYEYQVDSQSFRNDAVSLDDLSEPTDLVQETVSRYPAGKTVTVYYRPDDPADSLLERDLPSSDVAFLTAVGLCFLGAAVAMVVAARRPDAMS